MEYILKKLYLKEGMSLLDIGCGWGYLLIRAAKEYGISGMGITLSEEQFMFIPGSGYPARRCLRVECHFC